MKIKKIVAILVGIMLIAFGVGLLSLNHYGYIRRNNKVNIGLNGIDIDSNDSKVQIGPGGIHVEDGDGKVSIGPKGINIEDSNDNTNLEIKSGFFNWLGNLFDNVTITRLDLVEENIDEERHEEITGISLIDIDTSFIGVNIIPEDRDNIRIHYNGYLKANYIPELTTDKSGDTLYISFKTNRKNSHTVVNSTVKLDVYIPNTYKDSIIIDSSSGDLHISNMELNQLDLKTSSGYATCENVDLDKLLIETSSGHQIIRKITSQNVNLSASSGYITVEDAALDKLFIETSSGDQVLNNVTSNESNLTASSGYINASNYSGDINTNTSSGDVKLNYSSFDNNIVANASSGEVEIILPKESQFNLDADTSSGRIEIDFPIMIKSKDDDSLSGTVGNSSNTIEIITTSGDIRIRSK